jgi:hypothetical protein
MIETYCQVTDTAQARFAERDALGWRLDARRRARHALPSTSHRTIF